jgi:MFS family permease
VSQASPGEIIKSTPMSLAQYVVVALCVLTYAADGIDVASITYAAPAMIEEWGVRPETFGLVYSATPVGIVLSSFLLAPLGDRFGRRTVTVSAIGVMTVVLFLMAFAASIEVVAALRFAIGLCIGTLVVSLNVTVAEFASEPRRNLLVGILHTGYSLGGMACAALAAFLIEPLGWRALFLAAAAISLLAFLFDFALLSESPAYLVARRPKNALERLNRIFGSMKKARFDALPPAPAVAKERRGFAVLSAPELRLLTILLCGIGFVFTISGSFLASWRPQILADAGLSFFWNGMAGVSASASGIVGHVVAGALARRGGEARLAALLMLGMAASLIVFGLAPREEVVLIAAASLTTFFTVAAYTSLIVVALSFYPAENRNAGLGLMVGWERMGGILGPTLGGLVIGAGLERSATLGVFAVTLLFPIIGILVARRESRRIVADAVS